MIRLNKSICLLFIVFTLIQIKNSTEKRAERNEKDFGFSLNEETNKTNSNSDKKKPFQPHSTPKNPHGKDWNQKDKNNDGKKFIRPPFRPGRPTQKGKGKNYQPPPKILKYFFMFFFFFGVVSFFVCLVLGFYFAVKKFNEWYLKKQEQLFKSQIEKKVQMELQTKESESKDKNQKEELKDSFIAIKS